MDIHLIIKSISDFGKLAALLLMTTGAIVYLLGIRKGGLPHDN